MNSLKNEIVKALGRRLLSRNNCHLFSNTKFKIEGDHITYAPEYGKSHKLVGLRKEDIIAVGNVIWNNNKIKTSVDELGFTVTYICTKNPISGEKMFATKLEWRREIQCGVYTDEIEYRYIMEKNDIEYLLNTVMEIKDALNLK